MITISIEDNSAEYLDALSDAIGDALDAIGRRAVEYAQDAVPVDTGALKASVGYQVEGNELTVGADTEYAAFVEMGTYRQKAQPYLRPSLEEHGEEYKILTEDALINAG